uniref:Uncharacterized protein n=1 Tax=Chenopodium quinoa TaxID=63459 RepID=A0A803MRT0_CHEQI
MGSVGPSSEVGWCGAVVRGSAGPSKVGSGYSTTIDALLTRGYENRSAEANEERFWGCLTGLLAMEELTGLLAMEDLTGPLQYGMCWRNRTACNGGVNVSLLLVKDKPNGAAYIFGMSKKKDGSSKSEKHEEAPPPATSAPTVTSVEKPEYATATPTAELALPAQTSEPAVNFYGQPIVPATPAAVDVLSTDESVEPEYPPVTPIAELVKVHEPITEDQQREIFKWILDEKRKVKPRNRDEKKQIDEEKAMLKQFIRGKSNPSL